MDALAILPEATARKPAPLPPPRGGRRASPRGPRTVLDTPPMSREHSAASVASDGSAASPNPRRPRPRQLGRARAPRPEVMVECCVCGLEMASSATQLWCPAAAHAYCGDCAAMMIQAACDSQTPVTCAFCTDAEDKRTQFDDASALRSLALPAGLVTRYMAVVRQTALVAAGGCVAACPSGCGFQIEVEPPVVASAVRCLTCNAEEFCTRCGAQPFHFGLSCAEYTEARANMKVLLAVAAHRPDQADREWVKLKHAEEAVARLDVRCCPSCGAAITRISGCNYMVCGRDSEAAEGSRRGGCGTGFDWSTAPRYQPRIPPRPSDSVPFDPRGDHPGTSCACCGQTPIQGTRFQCVNCPSGQSTCSRCFEKFWFPVHANGQHVFVAVISPEAAAKRQRDARRRAEASCCVVC
eukprot:CAMPEP_0174829144 /NCGR_PEP_ID=MMETSP1114-20130205/1761_1 /TAXON_ID=312471 /ORGANISM="Neobodo designis, Strain CCAP 1951/1" /LENGTH=410 /DNA_ID=CAMNT_0016062887 /DNA_START=85 /DNA_END=1317 /DNA_ORIENTATION=+